MGGEGDVGEGVMVFNGQDSFMIATFALCLDGFIRESQKDCELW